MKGATLFSGIGAPEAAAPWIDWRWSADIDAFANAVRAHHWPDVPNLGDVSKLDGGEIEPIDILVFGSPCQSFSVAGKRLGLDDQRGNLALVALGLVAQLKPRWFVFENVPGLRSNFSGSEQAAGEVRSGSVGGWAEADEERDFAAFLTKVRECGYCGCWRSLDAQYAGVPQRRERIFFVGHLGDDWRPSAAILFEPESLSGHPPPSRKTRQDTAPTISARPSGGGGLGTDFDLDGGLIASTVGALNTANGKTRPGDTVQCAVSGHLIEAIGKTAHCLNAGGVGRQDYETEMLVAFNSREDPEVTGDRTGPLGASSPQAQAVALDTTQMTSAGNYSNPMPGDPCHPLAAGAHAPAIAGSTVRRLTPTECERLMGLYDGFTDIPWRGKRAPDSRRYKALGNSMAEPVIGWILDRIRMFEAAQ